MEQESILGSSPHTRGARRRRPGRRRRRRIIPAYAGSTSFMPPVATRVPDHPRIRGEHTSGSVSKIVPVGSSPHTRGARRGRPPRHRRPGIIPAYAGSTDYAKRAPQGLKDHPRIRGEHKPSIVAVFSSSGSSPHTRGARRRRRARLVATRIIPAYAGSTRSPPSPTIS